MSVKEWVSEYRRPKFWCFLGIYGPTFIGGNWFFHRYSHKASDLFGQAIVFIFVVTAFYPLCARYARQFR